jgi:hypothetical protein
MQTLTFSTNTVHKAKDISHTPVAILLFKYVLQKYASDARNIPSTASSYRLGDQGVGV